VPIATVASAKCSLLEQKEGPSSGRPRGVRGSHNGAHPEVTPSRVTLQRSAGPALLLTPNLESSWIARIDFGVARGGWAASNSHALPKRPRQTGLPGPTPLSCAVAQRSVLWKCLRRTDLRLLCRAPSGVAGVSAGDQHCRRGPDDQPARWLVCRKNAGPKHGPHVHTTQTQLSARRSASRGAQRIGSRLKQASNGRSQGSHGLTRVTWGIHQLPMRRGI
jgi:hypothetical protein